MHRSNHDRRAGVAIAIAFISALMVVPHAYAAGAPASDPIVGVIPENVNIDDIEMISANVDSGSRRILELVDVDGTDAIIQSDPNWPMSIPRDRPFNDETVRTLDGHRTFITTRTHTIKGKKFPVTSGRWFTPDGTHREAILQGDAAISEPILERLVERSFASSKAKGVRRIAEWIQADSGSAVVLGRSDRRTTSDDVSPAQDGRRRYVYAFRSSAPAHLVRRIGNLTGDLDAITFRHGPFFVRITNPDDRNVRSLRQSELRRIAKRVDRNHAAAFSPTEWIRVDSRLELAQSTKPIMCVRSSTDVACGQIQFSRLLDNDWVYVAVGSGIEVLANGKSLAGEAVKGFPDRAVFVIPASTKAIEISYSTNSAPHFAATVQRPLN